jgi:hypothetical protein
MSKQPEHSALFDDEPTFVGSEREVLATRRMADAMASLLRDVLPVSAGLVLVGTRPVAALADGESILTEDQLDRGALSRVLDVSGDDEALTAALDRIGSWRGAEHAVAHDAAGGSLAVAAVFPIDRRSRRVRGREVLTRTAAALSAWSARQERSPGRALLDAVGGLTLVHQDGIVVLASAALAGALGAAVDDLVGRPLAEIARRLPPYPRERSMVIGGAVRRVLVFGEREAVRAAVAPCIARALAEMSPIVQPWARIVDAGACAADVSCDEDALIELITLATLEIASGLDGDAGGNRLQVSAREREGDVVIEIAATGTMIAFDRPTEQLGAIACARRVARVGGSLEIGAATGDRRFLRLLLPAVRRP